MVLPAALPPPLHHSLSLYMYRKNLGTDLLMADRM